MKKHQKNYEYYHLISGVDLPIKTQNYIQIILIKEMFKYSACLDEHFIQTLIYNSKFKNNISYDTCLREIGWNRGCQYVFKLEDYDFLMKMKIYLQENLIQIKIVI